MWENTVQPYNPEITIRRMRFAFWISKAIDTHSEYVILIAWPQQTWLRERASMLCFYVKCLSCKYNIRYYKNCSKYVSSDEFDIHVTVHRVKFLIIKPTRCTNFSNLFLELNSTCSDSSSVHQQEFLNVHTAMVYVILVCWHIPIAAYTVLD
jgi:hypothetical protein